MSRWTTPTDRYNDGEAIRRGQAASAIMDSPIFREAIERAAERFYEMWLGSEKVEDREAAWAKSHALSAIEDELRGIIADGEVAASEIEE